MTRPLLIIGFCLLAGCGTSHDDHVVLIKTFRWQKIPDCEYRVFTAKGKPVEFPTNVPCHP